MLSKTRAEYDTHIIGANLKRLRIENGYSIEEIRRFLCLGTVQSVYKYESGKSLPPADTVFALMELYNVYSVREIIGDSKTLQCDYDPRQAERDSMNCRLLIYYHEIPKILHNSIQ